MAYEINSYIQGILPSNPKYFKEEIIGSILSFPPYKPKGERILGVMIWPEVKEAKLIQTPRGRSYEGQYLSGYKLAVELNVKTKVTYVADECTQSAHAMHFETLKSLFVVLPEEVNGKNTCDYFRADRLTITPYIEAHCERILNCSTIYQCMMIFVDVKYC